MKNNFKIGTIISFLDTIRKQSNTCMQTINFRTGIHFSTLILLKDSLLGCGYIEKKECNGRRTNLILTRKGRKLLNELKELRKR